MESKSKKPLLFYAWKLAFALCFLAAADAACATTFNWTNAASGGWNTAANWNPNGVPGANDTAIITNAGVTVSLTGATTNGAIILGTNGPGTVTLALAGQTLALNGPLTVNPSGSFTVDSGALVGNTNAVLHGTIGWSGSSSWGGTLTLAAGSTLNITTANNHFIGGCIFTNFGTVNWSGGFLYAGGGAVFYNYGLWNAQDDQQLNNYSGSPGTVFNNYGTFRKSGGASEFASYTAFWIDVAFNQLAGVIDVQNGTNGLGLLFLGGGSFTGGYITTNVSGLTVLSQGNFTLNGTVTGTNTWENAGFLVGTNIINGGLTWVAGGWNGAASVTIATNTTLIVAGGGGVNNMSATVVTNYGRVAWASGTIRGGNDTYIHNYGLWEAQSDQILNDDFGGFVGVVFNNFGTFRKTGTSGGGTQFPSGVRFNNAGTLDSQTGNISLQGAYSLANGTLNFGINSLTNYGSITLAGAASLTGAFSASLNNGYQPVKGNSFTNLSYGSFTGLFTNITLPSSTAWSTNYNPANFVLTVLNSPPVFTAPATNRFVVNELTTLTVTNTATDADLPPQTLAYSLVAGTNGMVLNPATGVLTWTPQATNSPSTNAVAVAVADNGTPSLGATNFYTVIVREVNQPPVLGVIGTQTVTLPQPFFITNSATEPNVHSVTTGYLLLSPPAGASINASGAISWTPVPAQTLTTNTITTVATNTNPYDLVNPHLRTTNNFKVIVVPSTTITNISMVKAGGTNLNLSWPGDHTGWRLEAQTNSLQAGLRTNWATVSGSVLTNQVSFPIGPTNGAVFFRLRYP